MSCSPARATGFLAHNWYKFARNVWLDDAIEHTGKAFLGMTFKCARCHDHKYDPVSQREYYQLRAIFEPYDVRTDPTPGELDVSKSGLARVYDAKPAALTHLFERGDPKRPVKETSLLPGVPAVIGGAFKTEPVTLPLASWYPALRRFVTDEMIAKAKVDLAAAEAERAKANEQIEAPKELIAAKAKVATAPKEKPKPAPTPAAEVFEIKDDFSKANPKLWETVGKEWRFKDGAVHQVTATRGAERLALRRPLPRDFELTCRYTHIGGTLYKSVIFRFDVTPDRKYANFVYTSAHAPGPKLHVAYTRSGASTYPPDGLMAQPIEIGKSYTLRFAVSDRLMNVWLNGKYQITYSLPDRRSDGRLELFGFDATVAFDDIVVRSLSPEVRLAATKNIPTLKAELDALVAKLAAAMAEKKTATAKARLSAVEARIGAEQAKHKAGKTKAAAKAERLVALAAADEKLLAAKHELELAKDKKKVDAAKKKVTAAAAAFDKAKKAAGEESTKYTSLGPQYSKSSTGRRLALARWIANRRNPLTVRVAVNHIWLRHFGQPLVEKVDNFGLRSPRPPLTDLLDYLAVEVMDNGWRMKHIYRLIVTSDADRMPSAASQDNQATVRDRDNRFLWRMNRVRMEAETVRDAVLHVAGSLDPSRGGPDLDHRKGMTVPRRSLYFRHAREKQI